MTRSPCWTATPPPDWAAGSWVNWRIWCLSLRSCPTTPRSTTRAAPCGSRALAYGDLIKWFTNRSNGLPAYIVIDMVTQEAEVVRLDEGMKYTTAEHFGRNLYRHLRFQYPTMMFDEPVFEIDEEGTPYWVCSRIVKTHRAFRRYGREGRRAGERRQRREPVLRGCAHLGGPAVLLRHHHGAVRLLRPVPQRLPERLSSASGT